MYLPFLKVRQQWDLPCGMRFHLSSSALPLGRLNAHPPKSGCHGAPYTFRPITDVAESSRYTQLVNSLRIRDGDGDSSELGNSSEKYVLNAIRQTSIIN